MAVECVTWALRQNIQPRERFVLMMLGDRADHRGVCWPSFRDLAERTGYARRTVMRAVSELERCGLLEVIRGQTVTSGRQTSNGYRLRMDCGVAHSQNSARRGVLDSDSMRGEGDRLSPSTTSCAYPVDNPVDNQQDLSTGVTGCHPPSANLSPSEGDSLSPLEDHINQDLLDTHVVNYSPEALEECRADGADTESSPAPAGADLVWQGEESGTQSTTEALARFRDLDRAFSALFNDRWRKHARRRKELWISVLAPLTAAQFANALDSACDGRHVSPPGPQGFAMDAIVDSMTAPAAIPSTWPPPSREFGRDQLAQCRSRIQRESR